MKPTKSLLSKTQTAFLFCMCGVFLVLAPFFYFLTVQFYAEDMIELVEAFQRGGEIPALDLQSDVAEGMMWQTLSVLFASGAALFITVRLLARRLWIPFDDTLRKTEQFNLVSGDLPKFMETDVKEFRRLNDSLSGIMKKHAEAFRMQKEFSENASHELQTPLAVMRGTLDLLLQENMTEGQMRLVGELQRQTSRMEKLNRNLLLLAKIDSGQYDAAEDADVADVLSELDRFFRELQGRDVMRVEDRRDAPFRTVRANSVLLESMVKNLVINAVRHGAPEEKVRVVLENDRLSVSNAAPDGKPLDKSTLFRRFSGSKGDSHGLGLAIVRSICRFHGWTVDYDFLDGVHCFTVIFRPSRRG
ncbi:MAG: sensor histidine kinase [Alloprevotella sp.]